PTPNEQDSIAVPERRYELPKQRDDTTHPESYAGDEDVPVGGLWDHANEVWLHTRCSISITIVISSKSIPRIEKAFSVWSFDGWMLADRRSGWTILDRIRLRARFIVVDVHARTTSRCRLVATRPAGRSHRHRGRDGRSAESL